MTTSSAASKIQANLQELFQAKLAPGDAHIRFQLTSTMMTLLSMDRVRESLVVEAEKITPLPNMPESFIGIMNSRDRVFCVFDLAQLLGIPSSVIASRQYQIIVLQTTLETPVYLGLAVSRLQGIVRLPEEKIQSSLDEVASTIAPYVSGVIEEAENTIPVLDFDCISEAVNAIS